MMSEHAKQNYVEFAAIDLPSTKAFFETVFAWSFVDFGTEYTAFSGQGLDGGFLRQICAPIQPTAPRFLFSTAVI